MEEEDHLQHYQEGGEEAGVHQVQEAEGVEEVVHRRRQEDEEGREEGEEGEGHPVQGAVGVEGVVRRRPREGLVEGEEGAERRMRVGGEEPQEAVEGRQMSPSAAEWEERASGAGEQGAHSN